jgi:DNA-directed RNA polymerase subunit delta
MQDLRERIAYLKGLSSGLNVHQSSPEGRVLLEMMNVMEDVVKEIQHMHSKQSLLEDYVETLDEDLADLEDDVYEEDELDQDDWVDIGDDYYEMECPNCHEDVLIYDDMLDDEDVAEIICPECKHTLLVSDEFDDLREPFENGENEVILE